MQSYFCVDFLLAVLFSKYLQNILTFFLLSTNILFLLVKHQYDARRALEKNGIHLLSGVAIGVKITDPVQLQMDEKMSGSNYKGFMVSLPSKSSIQNAGASSNLGDLPRPYDPRAGTNVNTDMGCSTGSVAMPAKSVLVKTMDLIFGI